MRAVPAPGQAAAELIRRRIAQLTIKELPVAMRPPIPSLILSRRAKIALLVVGIVIVLVHLGELVRRRVHQLALVRLGRVPSGLQHHLLDPRRLVLHLRLHHGGRYRRQPGHRLCGPSTVSAVVGRAAEPRAVPGHSRAAQATAARRPAGDRRRSRPAWRRRATGRSGSCCSTAARSGSRIRSSTATSRSSPGTTRPTGRCSASASRWLSSR